MLLKFLIFLGIYVFFAIVTLIVSFYFGYDSISKTTFFQAFFILGVCYLPAMILALIFRHTTFVKDLPYYVAGLAAIMLLAVIVPAIMSKEKANNTEWEKMFATATRDFICTEKSFITYAADAGRLLKYSDEPGVEHVTIIGDISEDGKDLKPFFGPMTSVEQFKTAYGSCKNPNGKSIFDVYGFKPDPYDLELMKTKK